MQQILIIEDDRALNQGLCKALKTDNSSIQVCSGLYASATDRQIVSCENLKDAKEQLLCGMPALILLDINLPDGSGLDFLQSVKRDCPDCPVILLTANDTDGDIVNGLELGADDYITKPFKLGELCSRIRALLRRAGVSKSEKNTSMECGDITIDLLGSRATLKGKALNLTSAEYRLLCLLVRNANRVVTRDIILNELWDDTGNFVDDNTLSVYVRRLREKVETDPSHPEHLITIRGFGYQWKEVSI